MKAKFKTHPLKEPVNGMSIDPDGVSLDTYKTNPVITINFDSSRTIGVVKEISIKDGCFEIDADFPEGEAHAAESGLTRYEPGIIVKEFHMDGEVKVITKCELLEISKVTTWD